MTNPNSASVWILRLSGFLRRGLLVLLLPAISGPAAVWSAPSVTEEILRAERFSKWDSIIDLSQRLIVDSPSDIPALTAVLDACVARGCKQNPPHPLRGKLITPELREFTGAWIEFSATNPRRASERFRTLVSHPQFSWLGIYGLLEYAMETENVALLRLVIDASGNFAKRGSVIAEMVAEAQYKVATLTHDHAKVPRVLQSLEGDIRDRYTTIHEISALIKKDEFELANRAIRRYESRFGYDYILAIWSVEVFRLTNPPDKVLNEVERILKLHPNYWELRLTKASVLLELKADEEKVKASLQDTSGFPSRFANARRLSDELQAIWYPTDATKILKSLTQLDGVYEDYPRFHSSVAHAFLQGKNFMMALKRIETADGQTPRTAAFIRRLLLEETGKRHEAIKLLRELLLENPREIAYKMSLAHTLYMTDNFAEAKRVLKEVRSSKRYYDRAELEQFERDLDRRLGLKR